MTTPAPVSSSTQRKENFSTLFTRITHNFSIARSSLRQPECHRGAPPSTQIFELCGLPAWLSLDSIAPFEPNLGFFWSYHVHKKLSLEVRA